MVYLDHHCVTRPSKTVLEQMHLHWRETDFPLGNLYRALEIPPENHFLLTPGGNEAIFEMLLNFYLEEVRETGKNHFLTLSTENDSRLEELGCFVKTLPSLDLLDDALKIKTALFSLPWADPLTGVIQPIEEIIQKCHAKGVKVHVDASCVIGKIPVSFEGIDFITFDGDKIHTPKGIGGLFQKRKPRDAETNVPMTACLSLAVQEAIAAQESFALETARLRHDFETELKYATDCKVLFEDAHRLPHISAIEFPGIFNESLLYRLHRKNIFATIGGGPFISFGLSHETTEDDLAEAIDAIVSSVRQLKTLTVAL